MRCPRRRRRSDRRRARRSGSCLSRGSGSRVCRPPSRSSRTGSSAQSTTGSEWPRTQSQRCASSATLSTRTCARLCTPRRAAGTRTPRVGRTSASAWAAASRRTATLPACACCRSLSLRRGRASYVRRVACRSGSSSSPPASATRRACSCPTSPRAICCSDRSRRRRTSRRGRLWRLETCGCCVSCRPVRRAGAICSSGWRSSAAASRAACTSRRPSSPPTRAASASASSRRRARST
mmetsp:Transcript_15679/g.51763  ORF Transcript_15679/g.51763 Transcript_15679/m.51763 type:complete len:237 (-) Transcript_15679:711-1421(-)